MLDRQPYKTVDIGLNEGSAGDCFQAEMVKSAGIDYTFVRMKDAAGSHVAGQLAVAGGGSDFVMFDVAFLQSREGLSTATIRAKTNVLGNPEIPDYFWPAMNKCGYHP